MDTENTEIVTLKLNASLLETIDKIREEWGILSRADFIESILCEVLIPDESRCQSTDPNDPKDLENETHISHPCTQI
jgi:metal-responsive CopG/Arc/MetJ family transcriptional regulator